MSIVVSDLYFYPIKSCGGTQLKIAKVGARGIEYDRGWLLIDEEGKTLTQRDLAAMALIKPSLPDQSQTEAGNVVLTVSRPDAETIAIRERTQGAKIDVEVWGDRCTAIDQGDEAAAWFSEFLRKKCRLVRMAPGSVRSVDPDYATAGSDEVGFADEFPFLLLSEASLQDLNQRLEQPLPMNRFRPNVVVTGCASYAEDEWKTIRIGAINFDLPKPCARCVITTIDQKTTEKAKEPLQTLAKYRSVNNKLMFGQNMLHKGQGEIAVGDVLDVIEFKAAV